MDSFLLDCCFNSGYEGQKFRESTPRYANRLCAMMHSAESQFRAMKHRAESIWQNFDTDSALCSTAQSQLCAMKHSAESQLRAM
jgi:hypothetical protein